MRDHLVLYINGARHEIGGSDAFLSLSDFLRLRLGLIGTKIVCSEGDCGACTTLIGRPAKPKAERGKRNEGNGAVASAAFGSPLSAFEYRPVDSCIQFMFQLDGAHVVTVEGLRPDYQPRENALNPVQQAMIDCHGSQCGFCTPGFVMAMNGLLEEADAPEPDAENLVDEHDWRRGLTGNLCRCTGYTPILDAAMQACQADRQRLNDLYPPAPILASLRSTIADALELTAAPPSASPLQRAACPPTLTGALAFLAANPTARIIAGATDVGVRANKSGRLPPVILDLNRIAELDFVRVENGALIAGARASWTSLLGACSDPPPSKGGVSGGIPDRNLNGDVELSAQPLSHPLPSGERGLLPELARILTIFAAPQIRHVGTIGGNIANASPIADSLPCLYVLSATLVLASAAGRRELGINDFYLGYKQLDLKPGELIAEIRIPLPAEDELFRLYKVSRRRDLDISTFTAAIRMRLDGETIASAQIAFGGVGPVVLRAPKTEQFLVGQTLTEDTMRRAGDLAEAEIAPISDVRGTLNYRRQLARNVLLKFYHQSQANLTPA